MHDTTATHQTASELLQTKLYRPVIRPGLVSRERLHRRLNAAMWAGSLFARKLTLVAAPAGFGKTTLVASWLAELATPTGGPSPAPTSGWLSLDEEDNDPARFLRYVLAALQPALPAAVAPALAAARRAAMSADAGPNLEGAVRALINAVATAGAPVILVLDDVHVLHSANTEALMATLIDHQPPNLHLVLATRSDPALPLARLRARGHLLELRAQELRFTETEAAAFLTRTMGLDLQPEWIAALEQRTEGWIAGLQLAALSLHGRDDAEAFIQAFSGSHRYVIDYLVDEVLSRQPAPVRDFLVRTSILAQLYGPLCEAVLGHEADGDDEATGQAMLERLDRANLFLIPLDDRRRWYRYHHLFADSLRILLDPEEAHKLHRRAARWFVAHASPLEAVRHARATDDLGFTAEMIEHAVQQPAAWSGGELATLVSWLDALPEVILNARPTLSLHASRALFLSGRITRSERLLDRAVAALQGKTQADLESAEVEALLALADVYRGATAAMRGQVQRAVTHARQALARLPASDDHARARALDTLGLAYLLAGEARQAEIRYLQASDLAQIAGVAYLAINARCEAAKAQIHQGRLRDAAQTCREALALGPTTIPPQGLAWTVLGEIAYEQNDLPIAEAHLQKGLGLSQQGGITDDVQVALSSLVWLRQAQGDEAAARRLLAQVTTILETYEAQWLMRRLAAARARLDLAQGHLADAVAWADDYATTRDAAQTEVEEDRELLTLARVRIATDKAEQAHALLDEVRAKAEAAGRQRTILEALVLTAIACPEEAPRALGDAVAYAAPEGWLRPFLDEGAHLAPLLPQVRDRAPAFVDELLDLIGTPPDTDPAPEPDSARHALDEPLSERELEILALLAEGMTNREIAAKLFLAVGTIKWYLHNLYETLDVGNRTEAVAQARELGLIS